MTTTFASAVSCIFTTLVSQFERRNAMTKTFLFAALFCVVFTSFLAAQTATLAPEPYTRYQLTPKEREEVFNKNRSWWTGKVHDPVSGAEIKPTDKWDAGHKPGQEFWRAKEDATNNGKSSQQFRTEQKKLDNYRPELPSSNRSRVGEMPRVPAKTPKGTWLKTMTHTLKWLSKST